MFPKSKFETKELVISAQADSSHQDVIEDRSSSYGFAIFANGSPISWHSKKSPQVCWSSCESEYHTLAEASCELKFVDNILSELCIPYKRPFLLQSDSEPVMAIAKIPHVNQRTKQYFHQVHCQIHHMQAQLCWWQRQMIKSDSV